jgi:hypothetical protein
MIIKKYAESNVDESCFYGKVEVETNTKVEWENVIRILQTMQGDNCVCRCNLKENAKMVATILDHDVENQVCPLRALEAEDGK